MKKGSNHSIIEFIRSCPLITMLLASVFVLTGAALFLMVKGDASICVSMKQPLLVSLLTKGHSQPVMAGKSGGDGDGNLSVNKDASGDGTVSGNAFASGNEIVSMSGDASGNGTLVSGNEGMLSNASADASANAAPVWQTAFSPVPLRKAKSPYYEDSDRIALTTDAPYTVVDMDYYKDALFIGDSRVQGLHDYGNIKGADFFCEKGLSVFDLMDVQISVAGQGKRKLKKVLSAKQYKKIYIMLGVNELGTGYASDFQKQYQKNLNSIRKLQPDANLFLMGMMHVTKDYARGQKVYNNDNIDMRNTLIAELANGTDILYLDMNVAVSGKKGGLKKQYTWDGVHLKAEYYQLWVDFLNAHGYGAGQ